MDYDCLAMLVVKAASHNVIVKSRKIESFRLGGRCCLRFRNNLPPLYPWMGTCNRNDHDCGFKSQHIPNYTMMWNNRSFTGLTKHTRLGLTRIGYFGSCQCNTVLAKTTRRVTRNHAHDPNQFCFCTVR
jgi:hypothetical protein